MNTHLFPILQYGENDGQDNQCHTQGDPGMDNHSTRREEEFAMPSEGREGRYRRSPRSIRRTSLDSSVAMAQQRSASSVSFACKCESIDSRTNKQDSCVSARGQGDVPIEC